MTLRAKVLTAIRWTAAARLLAQVMSWAITIIVIRILSPADYGLMAMAMVLTSFLYQINNLGLESVLIQKRDLTEDTRRQIFAIVGSANLSFFLILLIGAPAIAGFFGEPDLVPIIRVLSIQFVFLVFEALPLAKLERELDFKRRSIVEFVATTTGTFLSLALALSGMGVWALVWGTLAIFVLKVIGINLIAPSFCWPKFSLKGMREDFAFAGFITLDKTLWAVFAEADKFIGGKFLGKELLGFYSVANHMATLPINKLAGLVTSVAFPAFSEVQTAPSEIRFYLLKAIRLMSMFAFPVFLGMSSIAPEAVRLVLGEQWGPAALPLQILALVMPLRMVSTLFPPVLWGVGKPSVSAGNFFVGATVMPIAFYIGSDWGLVGLCVAWVVAYPVVFLVSLWRTGRIVGLGLGDFTKASVAPAVASVVMYLAVSLARPVALGEIGSFPHLLQLIAVGGVVYIGVMLVIGRDGLRETLALARGSGQA